MGAGPAGTVIAMTGERTALTGPVARWMLLACTLFGLAAMHTLGHAGMRMDEHVGHRSVSPAAAAVMDRPAGVTAAMTAVTNDCLGCVQAGSPAGPGHGGMAGWDVCLAVLTGLAVLVLLTALLVTRSRREGPPARAVGRRPRGPRGPPRPTGLTLAAASVLRI